MGIFSKKPDLYDDIENEEEETMIVTLYTTAPGHWPVVQTEELVPDFVPGGESMNIANFGTALKKAFESSSSGVRLNTVLKAILTPNGILEIPFEVNDNGRSVHVFLYSSADQSSSAKFHSAARILQARGYPAPVYYAPGPLGQASAMVNPTRPFSAELLSRHKGELTKGNYAMLWTDENNPDILKMKCFKDIYRTFQAFSGVESYVVAAIFRTLGLVEAEVARMKLPQKPMTIPVDGPEDQLFILSVSEEKGIRFHFNRNLTSAEYRDAFYSVFAAYAEAWKVEAGKQRYELDYARGSAPSLNNWMNTINLLYSKGSGVSEIGVLTI